MVWLTEDVMGLVVDPAALGGLAGLIALASWALGRMQGGVIGTHREAVSHDFRATGRVSELAVPPAAAAATVPMPHAEGHGFSCQLRTFEERRALLAQPLALAELHAEASAIRRDARIFMQTAPGETRLAPPSAQGDGGCRYVGLSGEPTCFQDARHTCTAAARCQTLAPPAISAAQPSEASPPAARV